MSLVAAILTGTLATASPAPLCAGCTLDAPAGQALPLLVVLDDATAQAWRTPARAGGFAMLTLVDWQRREPAWLEDQVFAAARQRSVDLARVYLVGGGDGAAYVSRHVSELSETFAAVAITSGGAPPRPACPSEALPAYVSPDANDALRLYFERCRQPVLTGRPAIPVILDWLRRRVRVTTVSALGVRSATEADPGTRPYARSS